MARRRNTSEQPVEMVESTVEQTEEVTVIEEPVVEQVEAAPAPKVKVQQPCGCGCGTLVSGRFAVGHDMKLKSRLLVAFDGGDEAAGAELVERGWRTPGQLEARRVNGPKARSAASAESRRAAKIAKLEARIAELTAERVALVGEEVA